ncbi:hypothetical protein [Larkinella terrae]|uniref:Uncharacterized protein n=1 Tax=Larkinella terrae TaxID=2025311 RepID=A0A7K0EI06_9BACT|nr:hypothetical protein [Larkinella terrae]MRS61342.1 hypothetical protein [Larkinella terrae]
MSQHPIDDLFARQLRDHGVKPERATWEELQRRMNAKEERKSSFIWWYASAASVGLLLLASWWLWSGDETGKADLVNNRIAHQATKKTAPAKTKAAESQTNALRAVEKIDEPVIAYEKTAEAGKENRIAAVRRTDQTAPQPVQGPIVSEKPVVPATPDEPRKPETLIAEVTSKEPERTLVVQIAAPEIKPTTLVAATEPTQSESAEDTDDQPRKKRFRLGRVLRQINKLKAGEPVEWNEVGVQPGTLLARASEKVHEGKEKLTDSYENLRYNAFKKNSNNK